MEIREGFDYHNNLVIDVGQTGFSLLIQPALWFGNLNMDSSLRSE